VARAICLNALVNVVQGRSYFLKKLTTSSLSWRLAAALLILAAPSFAQSLVELDANRTTVNFTLGSTLHTVHGTFRVKSGKISFDPESGKVSGLVIVDATSGESGNDGRDAKMHREILESKKYPEITFAPLEVQGDLAPHGDSRVQVRGIFTLHGQDHEISVPAAVHFEGSDFALDANFPVPYIKWGLKNPSTFILRASDTAQVSVHAVGHLTTSPKN
jgi:polyisoprenoid-binding protein YceI